MVDGKYRRDDSKLGGGWMTAWQDVYPHPSPTHPKLQLGAPLSSGQGREAPAIKRAPDAFILEGFERCRCETVSGRQSFDVFNGQSFAAIRQERRRKCLLSGRVGWGVGGGASCDPSRFSLTAN